MLYIASIPGFFLILGMQFAVDSPRWLCKVGFSSFSNAKTLKNLVPWYLIHRDSIFCLFRLGGLMMLKKSSETFGGHLKLKEQLMNFKQS